MTTRTLGLFVIQRTPAFVARPGSLSSYTPLLHRARTFATREQAEAERCPGNERVRSVEEVMRHG